MISLSRMQTLLGIKRRLPEKYQRKFESATRITATLTGMPRGSDNHSKVEDGAVDMVEITEAYREVFEDLEVMQGELEELIPALTDEDDRAIMRLRYIFGHKPEDIWKEVGMSRRAMFYHLAGSERSLLRMFPDKVRK